MEALGFGVAGIGAASADLSVLHDTDEMLQSGEKFIIDEPKPWWVKHREIGGPTVEIDFNVLIDSINPDITTQAPILVQKRTLPEKQPGSSCARQGY